jgi:hypothetical protein
MKMQTGHVQPTGKHSHRPLSSDKDVLKLTLEDLQRENERLRDARGSVAAQLGPLPLSAAIVAGLVTGFGGAGKTHLDHACLVGALVAFGAMVLVGVLYSAVRPYRKLRDAAEQDCQPSASTSQLQYLERMIRIEDEVRGRSIGEGGSTTRLLRPVLPWRAANLQEAFDAEWQGLFVTKILFIAAIVLLIAARIS